MSNPNFVPTLSSDEIWRGQNTTRCLSDDLDAIEADIAAIDTTIEGFGQTYAAIAHTHDGYALATDVADMQKALDGKANAAHTHAEYAAAKHGHDDAYYTKAEANGLFAGKSDANHTHAVDNALSDTSVNPVQNKIVSAELAKKVSTSTKVNGKPLTSNITITAADINAEKSGAANEALAASKKYTDASIADLIGSADTTMDTLGEIQAAMKANGDVVKALDEAIGKKANVADLSAHTGNDSIHVMASEKNNWNSAYYHAQEDHAPSNAQPNQNAFGNVVAGGKIIAAKTATDTLSFEGSNVTVDVNGTNDKIIVGLTQAGVTGALGYKPAANDHSHTAQEVGAAMEYHTHSEYLPVSGGKIVGNLSVVGELGVSAPVTFDNKLVLGSNTAGIFGTHENGSVYHQFQPVNGNGRCAIGYGMYAANVGGTDIYGSNVALASKGKVSITGDLEITSKAAGLTDRAYGVNKVLWSGATYLHASQSVALSESVTAQPHGIVLVFSAYKVGTGANDTYWQHFFVPKYIINKDHAGGTTFILEKGGVLHKKYIYINDNELKGSDVNDNAKYVFHGQTVDNREVVLRYVIGV